MSYVNSLTTIRKQTMLVVVATNSDYTHSSIVQFYGPLPIVLTELDILDEVGCLYMRNYILVHMVCITAHEL